MKQVFRWLILFFALGLLSCGRTPNIPPHLDHDFFPGTADGLYRVRDLKIILDEAVVKPEENSNSPAKQPLSDYEPLYTDKDLKTSGASLKDLKDLLKIRTTGKGRKVKISSSQQNILIDPGIDFLNEYELLDYYTASKPVTDQQKIIEKLLGKVRDFTGFPDTDYHILPGFMGNYLILYKLGSPNKIPYDELPLAKRVGSMLAVPFVGYRVEYCQAVNVLVNLKKTLKFRPVCKAVKRNESFSYVRLREDSKQAFHYLEKLDFFQRDFFNGRWLHFRTLVRAPESNRGKQIEHNSFKSASVVEFRPALGKIDVVEVYDLKKDDERRALFIPVKWVDYEIAKDLENPDRSFSERLKEDINEINRPYLQIKFNELIANEFAYQEKGGKSLKSVIITKDYISFDVEITSKGYAAYIMKYAFKRYVENPDYREKQWFQKDSVLFFPMFEVKRKYYEDPADHTRADEDRFKRAVRFNPQSKEILWHFSKQTVQLKWLRALGYRAVDLLNRALQEAGKDQDYKIKISLDKSGADKEVGDIRYNILNLIFNENHTPEQLKLGQNIANPITGEVVSAAANVWVDQIFKDYISIVRRYIRFHVYSPKWKMKPFSQDVMNFIYDNVETNNLQCGALPLQPLGVTAFLHEKIDHVCKEVSQFIEDEKGKEEMFHPKTSALQDDNVVSSCVHKLARIKILHSIVHSMLHSLGLRDMLSASADLENFYKHNEIEKLFGPSVSETATASHPDPPQYSSVMDYMDLEYPILPVPGKLDMAVLRFLYFDKVDLKEGGTLEVPSGADRDPGNPQKSILQAVDKAGHEKDDLKKHIICGWDSNHPLFCKKNDYGVSPLEVVSNSICKAHSYLMTERNRYDGGKVEDHGTTPSSIRVIYSQWQEYRDNILAARGRSIFDYSFLNPDHIEDYKDIMKSMENIPEIKPYYDIRRLIFDYFKRLAFAPAKHCIYREKNGEPRYKFVALENIEEKLLRKHSENSEEERKVFMNCESPIVMDWAGKDKTLVGEVGFLVKKKRTYFIRPNEKTDPVDEETAFDLNRFVSIFDEILYEPDLGAEYYKDLRDYIFQGMDLNPYIEEDVIEDPNISLERVWSYKIDTMLINEALKEYSLYNRVWFFRTSGIENYKVKLQEENYPNTDSRRRSLFHFSYRGFSEVDLKEYAESAAKHPGLHNSEVPFLMQAYEEYEGGKTENHEDSFVNFIETHPAVLYRPDDSAYVLPYVDREENIAARLFRQYNEFVKCINDQKAKIKNCDEVEEKQAFIDFILDTYK